jgi:hypothetical protein
MPRLEVHIDVGDGSDADPVHVHGTVRTEDGDDVAFVGWIGLFSLLQQAVS